MMTTQITLEYLKTVVSFYLWSEAKDTKSGKKYFLAEFCKKPLFKVHLIEVEQWQNPLPRDKDINNSAVLEHFTPVWSVYNIETKEQMPFREWLFLLQLDRDSSTRLVDFISPGIHDLQRIYRKTSNLQQQQTVETLVNIFLDQQFVIRKLENRIIELETLQLATDERLYDLEQKMERVKFED